MKRSWLSWLSRIINSFRLSGLPDHQRRVRQSRQVLRMLRRFDEAGRVPRCIAYLRQIDPLTFEEVVLSALEDAGAFILRSRRYTGDGGLDGRFFFPGVGWAAIQAKRYASHIDHRDLRDFAELVAAYRFRTGIFAHTGRTGARAYASLCGRQVLLVSGGRLARLILFAELPHIYAPDDREIVPKLPHQGSNKDRLSIKQKPKSTKQSHFPV